MDALAHTPRPIHFALLQPKGLDSASGVGPSYQDDLVALFACDDIEDFVACRSRTGVVAAAGFIGYDPNLLA